VLQRHRTRQSTGEAFVTRSARWWDTVLKRRSSLRVQRGENGTVAEGLREMRAVDDPLPGPHSHEESRSNKRHCGFVFFLIRLSRQATIMRLRRRAMTRPSPPTNPHMAIEVGSGTALELSPAVKSKFDQTLLDP